MEIFFLESFDDIDLVLHYLLNDRLLLTLTLEENFVL
jgi:hypothetical protein